MRKAQKQQSYSCTTQGVVSVCESCGEFLSFDGGGESNTSHVLAGSERLLAKAALQSGVAVDLGWKCHRHWKKYFNYFLNPTNTPSTEVTEVVKNLHSSSSRAPGVDEIWDGGSPV